MNTVEQQTENSFLLEREEKYRLLREETLNSIRDFLINTVKSDSFTFFKNSDNIKRDLLIYVEVDSRYDCVYYLESLSIEENKLVIGFYCSVFKRRFFNAIIDSLSLENLIKIEKTAYTEYKIYLIEKEKQEEEHKKFIESEYKRLNNIK